MVSNYMLMCSVFCDMMSPFGVLAGWSSLTGSQFIITGSFSAFSVWPQALFTANHLNPAETPL